MGFYHCYTKEESYFASNVKKKGGVFISNGEMHPLFITHTNLNN